MRKAFLKTKVILNSKTIIDEDVEVPFHFEFCVDNKTDTRAATLQTIQYTFEKEADK